MLNCFLLNSENIPSKIQSSLIFKALEIYRCKDDWKIHFSGLIKKNYLAEIANFTCRSYLKGNESMFTKKFLISLIISCGILLSVNAIGFTAANPFRDVPAGHWAYNAVIKLAREGIFNGYGDGTFRGNRNITRYEAATFLARVMATFKSNNFSEKLKFTDVPNNHWAYNYVVFVAKNGINKGYDDNTFRGERYITRYEMAQMIALK